jgi:hypothetical protein
MDSRAIDDVKIGSFENYGCFSRSGLILERMEASSRSPRSLLMPKILLPQKRGLKRLAINA